MTFLRGLSAIPITPTDRDGRVDTPALRRLVARLRAARVDSIGLLGSPAPTCISRAKSAAAH